MFILLSSGGIASGQVLRVVSAENNSPVEGAHVTAGNLLTTTDAEGKASLAEFAEQDYLVVTHTGFVDTSMTKSDLKNAGYVLSLIPNVITMRPFDVVSAREKAIDIPQKVELIPIQEIERKDPRTAADMLEKTGNIFVQRSQLGGGSPIIRGFEANRILLVIDGVRMNNAIYRSGHLQNAISVDANILEETEVIYGPGSLVYGSDALGGVIHFKTKKPVLAANDTTLLQSVAGMLRYSSAAKESTAHADFNLASKKISWFSSFTHSRFDDLRMGAKRSHGDAEWGLMPNFITTTDGVDSIRINSDPHTQIGTGYDQTDVYQKLLIPLSDSIALTMSGQYSTSSDVPRFDRLNDVGDDGSLRFARWDYGPQNRLLVSATVDILSDSKVFDKAKTVVAYQRIDEDRINRRFGNSSEVTREEDVRVLSLNADMTKRLANRDVYYGIQMTSNDVASKAFTTDIIDGSLGLAASRYPDGGSKMSTIEAYMSMVTKVSKRFRYNAGVRYSHAYLSSEFKDTTFYILPFDEVIFDNGAFTGSLGATWKATDKLQVDAVTSTGFRSPNVDDYGKVFERDGLVVVPNDFLTNEYTLNGELGLSFSNKAEDLHIRATAFYTHIVDAIVQRDFTLNGEDSLLIDGELARIVTNMNASEARIYGLDITAKAPIGKYLSLSLGGTYTVGDDLESNLPLAHIPPVFGKAELAYEHQKLRLSTYFMYSGFKDSESIAPGRTDNPNEGLNGEFPDWKTINLNCTYALVDMVDINFSVENILDEHYKPFASGLSAPGRNFIFSIRTRL